MTYSFLITNTGSVTLHNITVNDTAFSGTGTLGAITCPVTTLSPSTSTTCTAGYTVTQADIDAGQVTNTATATGTPPSGPPETSPPSEATMTTQTTTGLTIVKSANSTSFSAAGQTIIYSFLVTNTGSVTEHNIVVNDALAGVTMPLCPTTTLAPAASTTCTATYVTTQAEVDAGSVFNSATATGDDPSDHPHTSPPGNNTEPATPAPGLTIVKSASPTSFNAPGRTITYGFLVTNTGNVTLHNVAVHDALPGLSAISCPSTTLAPAASMTCNATYTTTQADVVQGNITNVATTAAVDPAGHPVTSPESTVIIPSNATPIQPPAAPESPITPVNVAVTG